MSANNEFMVIPENQEKKRKLEWWTNKFYFTEELEKFLSYCPNMTEKTTSATYVKVNAPATGTV